MAAVVVSANNTRIAVATIATDTGTWGNDGGGGGVADEPDNVYQGTTSQSRKVSTTRIGRSYTHGSGTDMTAAATSHLILKVNATNASALLARSTPAMGIKLGSGSGAYYEYYLFGNDNYPPKGGFQILAVSPNVSGYRDATTGTPTLTAALFWSLLADFSAGSKSENLVIDAIDIGVGLAIVGGDGATADADLADIIFYDEGTTANRFGYITSEAGGKVAFLIGTLAIGQTSAGTSTITEFTEAGKTFVWRNGYTETGFNKLLLDIATAATILDFTNCAFISEGEVDNTAGRGYTTTEDTRTEFEVTGAGAASTADFDTCVFDSFRLFTLLLSTTFRDCVIINSGQIDCGTGADLGGTVVVGSTVAADTGAVLWTAALDPDGELDDMTIEKGAASHHAVEFGVLSPLTMTIRGMTTSGFNAADTNTDSTFYVKRTTGTVTINVVGGTGNFSYKSDGATVVIVIDPVTVQVTALDTDAVAIEDARVFLQASAGPLPFEDVVTIANSGTTATVTHTAHGMITGDTVVIRGASLTPNNGNFVITVTTVNAYTYTMGSTPGSSPTGTILSSFVALTGLTNPSGVISVSRTFGADQPVAGWVRRGTTSPLYKTANLSGTIDSTTGFLATAIMVDDE